MIGYMITNGNDCFIRHDTGTNKYVPIVGQNRGTVWKDVKKAENIHKGLTKNVRPYYYVVQVVIEDPLPDTSAPQVEAKEDVQQSPAKAESNSELLAELATINSDSIRGFEKWQSRVEDVLQFLNDAENRMNELCGALTEADREVSDLLHYMEFNQFNAYQGYMAYRKMHDVLLRRREIKNESKVMQAIRRCAPATSEFASVLKAIKNMDTQKYKPRVLEELFE